MVTDNIKKCFVLMPFRVRESDMPKYYNDIDHWKEVYQGLISPAAEKAGFICEKDDSDFGSRIIHENILSKIEEADLILCDLSSSNPNVFLEFGWALRADKSFVLIKDRLTNYEFDLNQNYTFEYSELLTPIGLENQVNQLAEIIGSTFEDPNRRYSIVRKLELSASLIEAAAEGDQTSKFMMDILEKINGLKIHNISASSTENFIWPPVVQNGLKLLFEIKNRLENNSTILMSDDFLLSELELMTSKLNLRNKKDIQISLLDSDRRFIFHDKSELVNTQAQLISQEGFNIYNELYEYQHGVVAWSDKSSNIQNSRKYRHNFGIWATLKDTTLKLFIELHREFY